MPRGRRAPVERQADFLDQLDDHGKQRTMAASFWGDLQTEEKLETTSGNSGLVGEGLPSVQHIGILGECVVS